MIEISNLSVTFKKGNICALEPVSFQINPGEKIVVIGETGSGKSVLIQAILGLLPLSANVSGKVMFESQNLIEADRRYMDKIRGNKLAYIPQGSGNALNPLLKNGFQIGEPLIEHRGFTKKEAFCAAVQLMKRFHIGKESQRASTYPHVLSGGMRQRVLIAMGISADAEWIFADEPTKGLDKKRIAQIEESFLELKEKAILCVTHDLKFAQNIGKKTMVMYAAQVVETGSLDDLFSDPLHPYTQALLDAQPDHGMKCRIGFAPKHEVYKEIGCRFADRCPECTEQCKIPPPFIEVCGRKVRCWKYVD